MGARLRSWWRKVRQHSFIVTEIQHPFIVTGIIVVLIVLIALIFAVYKFGWDWTGFNGGENKITTTTTSQGITTARELQPGKTLWDWLGLLAALAVPIVVGIGAAWFTAQQGKVSNAENTDNQRENALQAYINEMSALLLHEKLGELKPEHEEVRKIARLRTLTTLHRLDGYRKRSVLQFLREAGLIDKDKPVVKLNGAGLYEAVFMSDDDLSGANLSGADLYKANLYKTNLYEADLSGANLISANLSGADLSGAKVNQEQLKEAETLYRATMPDGSKYS